MKPPTLPASLLKTGSFATSILDPVLDPSTAPFSPAAAAPTPFVIRT